MKNDMPINWQLGRNGQIPRNSCTTKTETGRNRKFEQTHNQQRFESVIKNLPTNKSLGRDGFPGKFY